MGIYDRDYYRGEPSGGLSILKGTAPACRHLIAINIAVFILQLLTVNAPNDGVTGWLRLDASELFEHFQIWRVLTYAFCHDPRSLWHIVFNMLFLWWFGNPMESMYGSREFLRFYLMAAVISGIVYLAISALVGRMNPLIGASGATMAATMLFALYYPTHRIYLFFVFPVEMRWIVAGMVVLDLYPVLLALGGDQVVTKVGHAAHLGGLLYGYLYKRYDLRMDHWFTDRNWWDVRRLFRRSLPRSSNIRIYREPEQQPDFEQQVDEILAKITAQGEGSLTDRERQILKDASRRYKQR